MTPISLGRRFIPVCTPSIGEKELEYATKAIKTGMVSGSGGEFIRRFEEDFSGFCGVKHGVATTSGTTALHLCLASLGIGKGDEVIVSTFTNAATAFAIVYCGAKPVVVDSEPETWNIDVNLIESKITSRTKAILPVHIYGHPCDMDPILEIAETHNVYVVEDAAEAHGARYKGKRVGGLGDAACFSFYANKIITTGEGGMVVTNNDELADMADLLRNLAFSREVRFLHHHVGFNYRLSNVLAAIGLAQLERIEDLINRKKWIAEMYSEGLSDVEGVVLPAEKDWAENVYWMYCILIEDDFGFSKDELRQELQKRGIETRSMFIPMNMQPFFHKMGLFKETRCPVAEGLSRKGLYLPSGADLTEEEITYVCDVLKDLGRKKA